MGNDGLSTGDLALLKDSDGMGGANAWVWFLQEVMASAMAEGTEIS